MSWRKKPWKKAETARADRMAAEIGCIFCALMDRKVNCDHRHHVKRGNMRMGHWYTLPLCEACHAKCHNGTIKNAEQLDAWVKVQHILGPERRAADFENLQADHSAHRSGGDPMSTCNGCGGLVGRDCFNPVECEQITRAMESRHAAESVVNYEMADVWSEISALKARVKELERLQDLLA